MQENADLVFGGITIICGIFGTVAGGLILDKIGPTIQNGFKEFSILLYRVPYVSVQINTEVFAEIFGCHSFLLSQPLLGQFSALQLSLQALCYCLFLFFL